MTALVGHAEAGRPVGQRAVWPKGSVWLLEVAGGRIRTATYLPPRRQPLPPEAGD